MQKKDTDIEYPCQWQYKIIGQDKEALINTASEIFKGKDYNISYSKSSSGGKYHSFTIDTEVSDEKCRNDYFSILKKQPSVKMVL